MTVYIHTSNGTTADAEGIPPATAYAAGRWWDLRTLDPAALAACGWHPLTTTTRPTDTPTTTTDRSVVNQAGAWTETWTVRAWTTDELTAQARLANADTLTTQARTAIAGNQAAITAATTGQIATFKALTDTITGTLATTQTAVRATESAYETYLALTQLAELGELARASAADVADASRPPSNSLPLTLRV